jgi:hypothetical protein
LGIFSELVQTGKIIFNRLRDLIYVVAGFGIIAVAVGGFFGNLNWKWLGAIVISLVVIATAGELVVALTGCEAFSSSLVTNTLTKPSTAMSSKELARLWATNDQTTEGSTITDSAGSDNKVEENKEGNDENKEAAEGNNENKEASEGNNENKEASEQKDTVKVERGSAAGLSQELSSYTQLSIDTPKTLSLP